MSVQAVGAIGSATNALAQDFTQQQTLRSEAQELRTWLGHGITSILASDPGPAVPSPPTEMKTLMTPNTPPARPNGKLDMLI